MPTLAEILRQTGYSQDGTLTAPAPVEPTMTSILQKHIASLPQTTAQNLAKQRQDIDAALQMTPQGMQIADKNAFNRVISEAPNLMGSTAIYHGTNPEAAANIAKRGFNVNKSADGTIWFTENPEIGEVAATGKGAVIKRILDEEKLKLATPEQADKYFIDQLINEGYEGVKYPGYGKGDFTHYQIFNPKKLGKETTRKEKIAQEVEKVLK